MEGLIPTYGDLIAISHDMPSWGTSGEIVGFEIDSGAFIVSEPLPWEEGSEYQLVLRLPDGSTAGPFAVTRGASDRQAVIPAAAVSALPVGWETGRPLFAFGKGQNWSQTARVMAIRPRGEQVEIACVVEHLLVHTADQ
jgi:hypothetical protein